MEGTESEERRRLQCDFGSTVTFAKEVTPEKTETHHGYWKWLLPFQCSACRSSLM